VFDTAYFIISKSFAKGKSFSRPVLFYSPHDLPLFLGTPGAIETDFPYLPVPSLSYFRLSPGLLCTGPFLDLFLGRPDLAETLPETTLDIFRLFAPTVLGGNPFFDLDPEQGDTLSFFLPLSLPKRSFFFLLMVM